MTKSRTVLSAAVAAAALLGGTAGGTSTAHAQEITVWTLNFSNNQANEAMDKIATDFSSANPGAKVTIVRRGTDDHKTALRVAAGSDKGPDIYFSWAGLGLGGEYVKAGLSVPLDKYYTEYKWADRLVPAAASFADLYPGGKNGVPFTFKGEAVYYSKMAFEKAGISSEPKTYDELVAAAEKLKAAGIPAFTFGGKVNWHLMRLMDVILETKCGAEKHDKLMKMELKWTEEACATESFTEMEKWAKNYILSPFMGIDQTQSFNLFIAGRAAMMLEGDWLVGTLTTNNAKLDDYDIFPFPTGTKRLYGFAEYYYVSSKSQHPDLAAKFLDYYLSDGVQQENVGKFATTSINKNVKYENLPAISQEWLQVFKDYTQVYMNGDQAFPLDVTTEYFRVINEVAGGTMAPTDASAQLQAFIDKRG
ncbi:ABC transporter substrate-binding protein [Sinorhizobium arboris]|uniref:ABC transporter substrate-binding protein n=1 Tax=Sinorhizobium arboris TaxID=76745 RepID=UPI0003FD6D6F|nr:extracellular solute-binding protein [Sinorhizobium arboris]